MKELLPVAFLGLLHALDPDHIAAVSTIVAEQKNVRHAMRAGILWGLGHTAILLTVGVLVIVFGIEIPAGWNRFVEIIVGIVLVFLGIRVLRLMKKEHIHKHTHDGTQHAHFHVHHQAETLHTHDRRSASIGALHGLAGSGPLLLLFVTLLPTKMEQWSALVLFSIFSTVGMGIASALIGIPFVAFERAARFARILHTTTGIASIAIGLFVIARL